MCFFVKVRCFRLLKRYVNTALIITIPLKTYVVPTDGGGIQLRYNKGIGPFQRNNVTTGTEWIEKWKVIM